MEGALGDIVVLSLEQAVAAPYCSCRLAEGGARVIKIERKEGDFARGYDDVVNGQSSYFVWLNHGKESLVADIKNTEDRVLLHAILKQADVFIQNLAPGAAERAGFGSAALRELYPRLITVDISGYGDTAEYANMKAYDLLVQAESGLTMITGHPAGPGRVGVSVCDIACGMAAHSGILEALYERSRTGKGKGLAVSLFDGMADWMNVPLLHYEGTGKAPERVGLNHPSISPYGAFSTGDDSRILISIQNEREWVAFSTHFMEQPDLPLREGFRSNTERVANRDVVDRLVAQAFGALTREEATAKLHRGGTAYGFVNGIADLAIHPALRRIVVETPRGPASIAAPAVRTRSLKKSASALSRPLVSIAMPSGRNSRWGGEARSLANHIKRMNEACRWKQGCLPGRRDRQLSGVLPADQFPTQSTEEYNTKAASKVPDDSLGSGSGPLNGSRRG